MPVLRMAALVAAAFLAAPAAAETRVFDLTIGGMRAGELTLTGERNGTGYVSGSTIRATGLIGALSRFRYEGRSVGEIAAGEEIRPERHTARSRTARSDRVTDLQFRNGDPVRVSFDPPRSNPKDPSAYPGTIDPVSAAAAILLERRADQVCNRRVELFDGHRRSQVLVGRAEARDGTLVCNGRYNRLSGDALPTTDDAEVGFRLFYRIEGPDRVALERIETQTRFGLAVATARN
jgi:hypothetical protein